MGGLREVQIRRAGDQYTMKHCIAAYIVVVFCCASIGIRAADKPNILIILSDGI